MILEIRFSIEQEGEWVVLVLTTGKGVQLNGIVELVSVDFVSIENRNILVKGMIREFRFFDRNKVGFLSEYSTIYDDVFALVVVVVFCDMLILVSKKMNFDFPLF